ncbi:protein shisa-1-like [Pelodytes ibericus]
MRVSLVLALLLLGSCMGQDGEYCHGWADHYGGWHPGFQCPERYDPLEATYCCGSCTLKYCCTASEARLDQGLCPSEGQEPATGVPTKEIPVPVPMYFPFLLVGGTFLTFVVLGSLVGVCCCKCLTPENETQASGPTAIQSRLLVPEPSRELSRHSSSSSSSVARPSLGHRPQNICTLGPENMNLYMTMPAAFSMMGCPQGAQFIHPSTAGPHFMNYGVPGEHSIMMTPASYIDARSCYGQSLNAYGQTLNTYPVMAQQSEPIGAIGNPSKC